jgi:hypothetical protein
MPTDHLIREAPRRGLRGATQAKGKKQIAQLFLEQRTSRS